jgi:type IV pilus assembly protein PilE
MAFYSVDLGKGMQNLRKNTGFSLIELLIVLMIIGIISCFAYPSYEQYIARTHRLDGQTALLDLAYRLEAHHTTHHTYQPLPTLPQTSSDGFYQLRITHLSDTTYTLEAHAIGTQALNDAACALLTLDHLGIRGPSIGQIRCW